MGLNYFSDYGSGSSSVTSQFSPWGSQETWLPLLGRNQEVEQTKPERSTSYLDVSAKFSKEAVMQEFRLNGHDSPYDPDTDALYRRNGLMGLGPSSVYLRQKSWPAPERSPLQSLPRPLPSHVASTEMSSLDSSTLPVEQSEALTAEQLRVLSTLPRAVMKSLLRTLQLHRERDGVNRDEAVGGSVGCAFCRSNGERPAWYRAHVLRAEGRVRCPVLRALVCRRCGASGDAAHTLKYCPHATPDEREKSIAMMRSIRTAAGRRRLQHQAPSVSDREYYVRFGETAPSVIQDGNVYKNIGLTPLDPIWAALEKKLML